MDYDAMTIAIMQRFLKKDSNCIDVGAHTGLFIDEMLSIAPEGKHYAFEPIPDLAAKLKKKYKDNVEVYGIALSDSKGLSSFKYVESNPGYSGLKERRYDRAHEIVKDIKVYTDLLDNVIPPDEAIDFIKIDVEGAELQVFRGGYGIIRKNRPVIIFEHGLGAADFYNTTPADIFELLHDNLGLEINTLSGLIEGSVPLDDKTFNDLFYGGKEYYFAAHGEVI